MNQDYRDVLEKTISLTQKYGADASDIILNTGSSFSISAQNNEIDKFKFSGSTVLGVRAIKDQKVGVTFSESLDDDALDLAVKTAIDNAKNSDVNEYETICIKEEKDLISGNKYEKDEATTKEKIDFCLKLESEVKARDSRVQAVPYNGFSEGESATYYMNSLGTFGFDSEFNMSCYTSALIHEGDKNAMHYHGVMGTSLKSLDFETCVSESLEHASNWLNAGPVDTAHYDVVFTPEAFVDVFYCFGNIFSAKAAWEKVNPFADKLGTQVAHSELTITDVPNYKDAFFNYEFDSEGVRRKDLTLIENGELKNFFHNTATANYFKTQTTGHASRGPRSSLGVGGTNKLISSGTTSQRDITSGTYLEIHSLQGLHSGANSISGEFSFGASGYLCEDGKRVLPVKGITVAGNYHHMLMNIKAIGDVIHPNTSRSFFAPTIRFTELAVAGK